MNQENQEKEVKKEEVEVDCEHEKKDSKEEDKGASKAQKKLIIIMIICLSYMCCEIVYGLAANSLAILTDAADLLSDSAGFIINIIAIHYAKKTATAKLTFGYLKAEALGAFVSILLIWLLYTMLIIESIKGFFPSDEEEGELDAKLMLILSCCALGLNIFKLCIVGGHSHGGGGKNHEGHGNEPPVHKHGRIKMKLGHDHGSHGHGEDHAHVQDHKQKGGHEHGGGEEHGDHDDGEHGDHGGEDTAKESGHGHGHGDGGSKKGGGKKEAAGIRVAIINLGGDVLKSIGVIIISVILTFKEEWHLLDPIYTLVLSILVIASTKTLTKETFNILMEGTPDDLDFKKIRTQLLAIENVMDVHDLHIWELKEGKPALSCHLVKKDQGQCDRMLDQATEILHKHKIFHITVQIERSAFAKLREKNMSY